MSGLYGVVDSKRDTPIADLVVRMGNTMSHCPWYVVETHVDEGVGVGLGRIGIGIFNRERQPVCSEDGNLVVFLSGEFYNTSELRRDLKTRGHRFRDYSDLELILQLYQEKEEQFTRDLEGAFVLAIWNRTRQELLIANDHYGLYPLVYAHHSGRLGFAPEMKGILCDPGFHKELDLTALAEYMRFQQLLGEKTFFEGIKILPKASLLRYSVRTDSLEIRPYWDLSQIPELDVTLGEAVEEAGRLLKRAVSRLVAGPYRLGIYLSGGRDSRTLLGLAARERPLIHTATYGAKNSRDVVYARRIAKRAGSEHHYFEYTDGRWVQENAELHLELVEGFHSWIHSHGIDTLEPMREYIDLQLTGFCGDHLLGSRLGTHLSHFFVQTWDAMTFTVKLFELQNQAFSWPGISEGEAERLYAEPIREEMRDRALASLNQELGRLGKYDPVRRLDYFKFLNHAMRLTHNYVLFFRSSMEVRYPFLDYAFFDFVCGLPPEVRFGAGSSLYQRLINREVPELALIPLDKDERLLTSCRFLWVVHALAQYFKREINRYVAPVFLERATLYADYENYLRTDLREWGESILFDKRTLGRGIFSPQFIRSIWARHLSGLEMHTIGKIAPVMTYEMMLRRLYD